MRSGAHQKWSNNHRRRHDADNWRHNGGGDIWRDVQVPGGGPVTGSKTHEDEELDTKGISCTTEKDLGLQPKC